MKLVVRVLKEPLLHFLILASGLFVLAHTYSDTPAAEEPDTIVVSEQRIMSMFLGFQRTWQRPPTQQELEGLIEDYIKEEVFYREALTMGLDQDDTLIRRRLRQKLEFVTEDIADAAEPTDQQLQRYLDEHQGQYRIECLATFRHIFLSRERRGESLELEAAQMLDKLRHSDDSIDVAALSDPTLLPQYHENLRESELPKLYGHGFGEQLLALEPGTWSGPIESAYGLHLVFVHDKTEGRAAKLDEVRNAVRRDWHATQRNATKDEFYEALRRKYKVVVEKPVEKSDVSGTDGATPEAT